MNLSRFEADVPAEAQFTSELAGLIGKWEELGIDPDDFLKCAGCGQMFVDPESGFEPVPCGC